MSKQSGVLATVCVPKGDNYAQTIILLQGSSATPGSRDTVFKHSIVAFFVLVAWLSTFFENAFCYLDADQFCFSGWPCLYVLVRYPLASF